MWRSTATRCAILRRSSWRSPRNKRATAPLMIGHRLMGMSLLHTGDICEGRAHYDQAIALYDPAEHRPLATRFGQDAPGGNLILSVVGSVVAWLSRGWRSRTLSSALQDAREIGQAATLMYALTSQRLTHIFCGNYAAANAMLDELVALADEKGALYLEGVRNDVARLPICCNRQSLGRSPDDHFRHHRVMRSTGATSVDAIVSVITWRKPMRTSANSMTLGAASAKQ